LFDNPRSPCEGLVVPDGHILLELIDETAKDKFGDEARNMFFSKDLVGSALKERLNRSYSLDNDDPSHGSHEGQVNARWTNLCDVYINESTRHGNLSAENHPVTEVDEGKMLFDAFAFFPGGTPGVLKKASYEWEVENKR